MSPRDNCNSEGTQQRPCDKSSRNVDCRSHEEQPNQENGEGCQVVQHSRRTFSRPTVVAAPDDFDGDDLGCSYGTDEKLA